MDCWLIGAGAMSIDYVKVLQGMNCEFLVVGRGRKSADEFRQKTGVSVVEGGLEKFLLTKPKKPGWVIVSVGVEQLKSAAVALMKYGVKKILLEKPGGIDVKEIGDLKRLSEKTKSRVFLGYNRRFYSSVLKAREMIADDGGVLSFNFEFTEWSHVIETMTKPREVMESWFLANSSHVADMAFYLGGKPQKVNCFSVGSLKWHPTSSIFAGSGVSDQGALFTYSANWEAPGRWGVEVLSRNFRFYFRPLEKLQVMKKGSVAIEEIPLDDAIDKTYKPGLFKQVEAFSNGDYCSLCDISEQYGLAKWYKKMAGYS